MLTEVDLAAPAEKTRPTTHSGIECHTVAGRPPKHFVAYARNYARRFMAHDQGRNSATRRAVHAVHGTAAGPAGAHLDQGVIPGRLQAQAGRPFPIACTSS